MSDLRLCYCGHEKGWHVDKWCGVWHEMDTMGFIDLDGRCQCEGYVAWPRCDADYWDW